MTQDSIPIEQFVENQRKVEAFDVGDLTTGIISQNIIQQKSGSTIVNRKSSKPTKKSKPKSRRSQNFDTSISSEEENSDDIEYDDGDDNAAVAGADEADSVGETEDTVGELQGLQDVQQASLYFIIRRS